jgi:hypothetical protein
MKKVLATLLLSLLSFVPAAAQVVTPTYLGHYTVNIDGNNTTYIQGGTHRYVNGELRFLVLGLAGRLLEFRPPSAFGLRTTSVTGTWDLGPTKSLNNFSGLWWEASKNRLWVTSAEDYTTTNHPAKVTLIQLGTGGSATVIKQFFLNVPAKRVYGGCNAVPPSLAAQLGGPYVCGWGGYTSLVAQGGGASIGPTMYAIPDPDTVAVGSTVQARTILDFSSTRGVRQTSPVNYFDGGDTRQNPSTRPTVPPVSSAAWLSPNSQGLGWMVWGDSYYNTGVWVGDSFLSIASLCGVQGATTTRVGTTTIPGTGACWYQSSTLAYDGRQFELHAWAGAGLGTNILKRPDQMTVLSLPTPNTRVWSGNIPTGNIGGATFDATTGRLYLIGFPFEGDYDGRIFVYQIAPGTGTPPPPPPAPIDATYGPYELVLPAGDWSACLNGTQTRTETWIRPELTPAQNGGVSIPLAQRTETRTGTQTCTVTPPPPPPPVEPSHLDLKTILDRIEMALAVRTLEVYNVTITSVPQPYANGDRRITIRVPLASMPVEPVVGQTLKIVKE